MELNVQSCYYTMLVYLMFTQLKSPSWSNKVNKITSKRECEIRCSGYTSDYFGRGWNQKKMNGLANWKSERQNFWQ